MSTNDAMVIPLPGADVAPRSKRKRKTKRSQGGVYERNGRWYMQFRVTDPATGAKERKTEPVEGATDRATALVGLGVRLSSIADRSYFKKPEHARTFTQVADEFQAWADSEKGSPVTYKNRLFHLRAAFGDTPITSIKTRDFESYRASRVAELVKRRLGKLESASDEDRAFAKRKARATVNREITVAKTLYNRMVASGEIDAGANPLARGKLKQYNETENARTRYLSPEEMARLDASCSEPFRSVVIIAIHMGLRRGEILRLRVDDVDLATGIVHIRRSKGGKPRAIRMSATVREVLECLVQNASGPYLFGGDQPASKEWAASAWKRVRRRAGLEDVHFHDLRHSCGTWAVAAGASLPAVREMLGHSSIKVTERYLHADPRHLQGAADALEKVWASRPKPQADGAGDAPPHLESMGGDGQPISSPSGRHLGRQSNDRLAAAEEPSTQLADHKGEKWRGLQESNLWPSASETDALSS